MTLPTARLRWLRLLAIAVASLILASCRSITAPLATSATAVTILPDDLLPAAAEDDSLVAAFGATPEAVEPGPLEVGSPARAVAAGRDSGSPDVIPVGLESPSPPLPRLAMRPGSGGGCGPAGCPPRSPRRPAGVVSPPCPAGTCRSGACPSAGCPSGGCPPAFCPPCQPAVPVIRPCLVCDGDDHGPPARAAGRDGLVNLTAGDTVARYQPADDGPDADQVAVVASNCACVFAPRFAAVREVVRPLEDAAPLGPGGMTNEELVALEVERQPVWGSVQNIAPEASRKALPGVAVQERLAPLAVDQALLPDEDTGLEGPAARLAIDQLEQARRRQRPRVEVGFDVPVAWTCIKAANVLANRQQAEVVAADRGTATLRFESPGRSELTLCKRAGTDTARRGEEIDFMIYLLNSGDRPLTDIVLADALPKRLLLVPDSAASSLPADFTTERGDDGSVVLTWRLTEPLPAGESGFVRFRTLVQ
jgi:uncharacterized repeat protein (TIGR01451 family)